MKANPFSNLLVRCRSLCAGTLALLPVIASAHPGHSHPEEHDEFDSLRANFLHLHGNLEIGLVFVAIVSVVLFKMTRKLPFRLAAAITFGGALAIIAAH